MRVWQIGAGLARVGESGVVGGAHEPRGGGALCAVVGAPLGGHGAGVVTVDEVAWEEARRLAGAVVVWTGALGGDGGSGGEPAWGPAGAARLEGVLGWAAARSRRDGVGVWLRTHAGHVLSDGVGARRVGAWAARQGPGVRVLWDLPAMLTAGMLARAQDHIERMIEDAGESEGVGAVLLAGAQEEAGGGSVRAVALSGVSGGIDARGVIGRARRALGGVPVLMFPEDAALAG